MESFGSQIESTDPSWLNGPPYSVEEVMFDENELVGCFRNEAELLGDSEPD